MRPGRRGWVAVAALAFAAGCTGSGSPDTGTTASPAPTATAAPTQRVWYRGVGVSVPASWPHNRVECSRALQDTVVLEPPDGFICLDRGIEPGDLGVVSYAWFGYQQQLRRRSILGGPTMTSHFLATLRDDTVDGEHVRVHGGHLPDGRHLRFVWFPRRHTYLTTVSPRMRVVRSIDRSIGFETRDAVTGCRVHSHRYDDGIVDHHASHRTMVHGGANAVTACMYYDGWLDHSAVLHGRRVARLTRLLNRAPPTSDAHPHGEWPGCIYVQNTLHIAVVPIALSFDYGDGPRRLVVMRPVYCTSMQSFVTNGARTRRLTVRAEHALPLRWNIEESAS